VSIAGDVKAARSERGASLLEVLVAVAVAATAAFGAIGAQWSVLQADRALQNHTRAALIADAALELMRAGQGEALVLAAARRDAPRQLRDGTVNILRDGAGANVLFVGWSEPGDALGGERGTNCPRLSATRAGHVVRCVSVGYVP
jgi:type IV pilus assembly protein PilV